MDLKTRYLGLDLPHPFLAGASPLSKTLDSAKKAEDGGAAAMVVYSLFEEQFTRYHEGQEANVHQFEDTFAEATSYFTSSVEYHYQPEQYLEHIRQLKDNLGIPVVGSLNGTHTGTWVEYARNIEEAGADALELNLYYQPNAAEESASEVESRLLEIIRSVRKDLRIPLAVKLSPFFTSIPHFAREAKVAGADALVLFNRFYQPDIDTEELEIIPHLELSTSSELHMRLRWISMLYGRNDLDLAVTGGIHTAQDAAKAIMCGASAIQLVSCLLKNGPARIAALREHLEAWMEEKEYDSLQQMLGSMSYLKAPRPEAIERANYLKILQSWSV